MTLSMIGTRKRARLKTIKIIMMHIPSQFSLLPLNPLTPITEFIQVALATTKHANVDTLRIRLGLHCRFGFWLLCLL